MSMVTKKNKGKYINLQRESFRYNGVKFNSLLDERCPITETTISHAKPEVEFGL